MFTVRKIVRRVFWKRTDVDISHTERPSSGEMKDTPVDSIYRTFEVFFLAHHSLLAVKENVAHLITQAFSDLTKAEKAHLQSIAHRDAKGNLTHWSQDGHQMKRTIEIVSRFTVPSTKK